jgi:hypothetical protein
LILSFALISVKKLWKNWHGSEMVNSTFTN